MPAYAYCGYLFFLGLIFIINSLQSILRGARLGGRGRGFIECAPVNWDPGLVVFGVVLVLSGVLIFVIHRRKCISDRGPIKWEVFLKAGLLFFSFLFINKCLWRSCTDGAYLNSVPSMIFLGLGAVFFLATFLKFQKRAPTP